MEEKQTELARDTRHCRMQEVNRLCRDGGPLRAEYCIMAFHTIHPSSIDSENTFDKIPHLDV